jgi:hypothetical protein
MIGYDASRDLLLLADRDLAIAILVDISIIVNSTRDLPFLRGGKATLMVSGYLEICEVCCVCFYSCSILDGEQDEMELPGILNWAWEPATIIRHVILQATLLTDASKLDWAAWNKGIEEREQAGLGFSLSSPL